MRARMFEPEGTLTRELTKDALALAGARFRDPDAVFAPLELLVAYDWAMRQHLRASDHRIPLRPRPSIVVEVDHKLDCDMGEDCSCDPVD